MAKSGPQLHDYYFEKYELLTINTLLTKNPNPKRNTL